MGFLAPEEMLYAPSLGPDGGDGQKHRAVTLPVSWRTPNPCLFLIQKLPWGLPFSVCSAVSHIVLKCHTAPVWTSCSRGRGRLPPCLAPADSLPSPGGHGDIAGSYVYPDWILLSLPHQCVSAGHLWDVSEDSFFSPCSVWAQASERFGVDKLFASMKMCVFCLT